MKKGDEERIGAIVAKRGIRCRRGVAASPLLILRKEYDLRIHAMRMHDFRHTQGGKRPLRYRLSGRFLHNESQHRIQEKHPMALARTIHADLFRVFLLTLVSLFAIPAATLV
ncbi:MAG: hypothetical protein JF629_31005, partial [Variovorax paradoxus]